MSSFHLIWGYASAAVSGVVGLWGVGMARRPGTPRVYWWAIGIAMASLIVQVVTGVFMLSSGPDPGDQHVFYGVVIAVTMSFVYIYRSQFRKRPNLYYGLALLFMMGLAVRGIMTLGINF